VANGTQHEFERDEVTDDFAQVFRLEIVRGRWFSREDDAAQIRPIVLNQRFAETLFGDEDPVGQLLVGSDPGDAARVVGVVSDFRKGGELSLPGNFRFERANLNDSTIRPPRNISVRVRPGTTAEFEEKLATTLQATVRDWSYDVQPIAELREDANRIRLVPLAIGGLVAGSLLAMVGLGIAGVVWQSVTRRRMELGLRRVQGATARDVFAQILGELLVVTTVAVAAGLLVVLQVPLLEIVSFVDTRVYTVAVGASVVFVYGLAIVAGLYPSWLATRVQPVEALRYE
jgi:putative ABC transport system permease protein